MKYPTLFLMLFTAVFLANRAIASAEVVRAKDGISCLFKPTEGMPNGAMVLLTKGKVSELSWSDYETPEGMEAWYITSSHVRVSIAGYDGKGTTKMLTLRLTKKALLTIHEPSDTAGLKTTTLNGTCSMIGEGLW